MSRSPLSGISLNRRGVLKGAAGAAGAAALAGRGVRRSFAQDKPFDGTTVTWMSNQRHDEAVKETLFAAVQGAVRHQVEMQIFADEYKDQLKLAFESGNPPDIFNMNSPRQEVEAGWPEPLDDLPGEHPWPGRVVPAGCVRAEPRHLGRPEVRPADVRPDHAALLQQDHLREGRPRSRTRRRRPTPSCARRPRHHRRAQRRAASTA